MLDIRLLGEQRFELDGVTLTAAIPPRTTALVAYLVLHEGRHVPRSAAAALFWPDSGDEQALTNLRRELHVLRRRLPPFAAGLRTAGRLLRWDEVPPMSCDVLRFLQDAREAASSSSEDTAFVSAASSAVAHYRGELLPAWSDDWVLAERASLHRRCLDLLDALVACGQRAGDLGAALAHARRRTEMEPLEESGYRTVMTLQATLGDRAAALRTYHHLASLLESELGVSPDPATAAVYDSLAAPSRSSPPGRQRLDARRVPLVGREIELKALEQRWSAAVQGRPGLHLLHGEAGVGKTRLAREVAELVTRQGSVMARARCFAAGGRLPLAPVAEWLATPSLRVHRDHLAETWRSEVERLVPTVDGTAFVAPQPMIDAWQRHRFLQGLVEAVLVVDRPTLLVLDDLQWCDQETTNWLQLLLRRAGSHALLVLATVRDEEMVDDPDLVAVLRALEHEGRLSRTAVAPLSADVASELANVAGAGGINAQSLFAATHGYPLFVLEAARTSLDDGEPLSHALLASTRVHALLDGRLDRLSEPAASVAALAAVVGRDFTIELLEAACDLSAETVVSAVDELWRRGIVAQPRPRRYDFSHDLLREACLARVPPARLTLLHRRIAQSLELREGPNDGEAAMIADHYEKAGVVSKAIRFYEAAARQATERFANDDAIRHYQTACRLLLTQPPSPGRDRQELAIRHAVTAPINARHGYASPLLEAEMHRSVELAERLGDDWLVPASLIGLYSTYVVQARLPEAYEVSRRALLLAEIHPDLLGQAHWAVGGVATSLGRLREALEHFALVPDLTMGHPPALVGTRPEVHSWAWESHALWLSGRPAEADRVAARAVHRAQEVEHPYSLAVALAYQMMLAQFSDRRDDVLVLAERTSRLCLEYEFAYYGEWARILSGWARGGLEGESDIRIGLTELDSLGAHLRRPYYLWLLADVLLGRGREEEAADTLRLAAATGDRRQDVWWLPVVLSRLATLVDEPAEAETLRRAAANLLAEQGSTGLASMVGER